MSDEKPRPGRPKGSISRATWLANGDKTPLETLLEIMRSVDAPLKLRAWAAKEAAPYCHRKMALGTVKEVKEAEVRRMTAAEMDWARDVEIRQN